MTTLGLLQLGTLLAFALLGCRNNSTPVPENGTRPPPPVSTAVVTAIDTNAGSFTSPTSAALGASYYDPPVGPLYTLGLQGRNATERKYWEITISLTAKQVEAESAEAQLGLVAEQYGGGEISSGPEGATPDQVIRSTSGTVSVTFGQGRVEGTAKAVPDELSGTFESPRLGVTCVVPPSMLLDAGVAPSDPRQVYPTEDPDGSMWVGVDDTDLVTPFCATLRHLRVP